MTQEDKELLLKDLCARLPYGVIVKVEDQNDVEYNKKGILYKISNLNGNFNGTSFLFSVDGEACLCDITEVKPYIRPLSSMTEEEKKEFNKYIGGDNTNWYLFDDNLRLAHGKSFYTIQCSFSLMGKIINFLLEHHFDYLGLIEKGLALVALDGMYNTKG